MWEEAIDYTEHMSSHEKTKSIGLDCQDDRCGNTKEELGNLEETHVIILILL